MPGGRFVTDTSNVNVAKYVIGLMAVDGNLQEKEGTPGQTVMFEELQPGDYKVYAEAYDAEGECVAYAQETATVKTGETTAVALKLTWNLINEITVAAGDVTFKITPPIKTSYYLGETFDSTGIKVVAEYKNGYSEELSSDLYTVFPPHNEPISQNFNKCSVKILNDASGTALHTVSFPLTLKKSLSSIAVTTLPAKTQYFIGEELDTTGMVVTAIYTDGSTNVITGWTPSGFNSSVAVGNLTVTVSYTEDGITKTTTFTVAVIPKPGDVASTGITLDGTTYDKTSEVYIVPPGTTGKVYMQDDSSWSSYLDPSADDIYKGVFLANRNVELSPYIMSQYEVTQELFQAVMGINPSNFQGDEYLPADGEKQELRPAEDVNWYHAITFCNKLSIACGLEPVYTVEGITDWEALIYSQIPTETDETWDAATIDIKKNGYRLPTEAEWEYAARGGNPNAVDWKYAFAGTPTADNAMVYDGSTRLETDVNLAEYGWYSGNSEDMPHEVGKKKANSLGLYDMSGNVFEWCWDWYNDNVTSNDSVYKTADGVVKDPFGAASGTYRVYRGGVCLGPAYYCTVSSRNASAPDYRTSVIGFRLVRSAQ